MKRDFLKELGFADDVIDKIMAEHGKDITAAKAEADAQKQQIAAKDTEIKGLKDQIGQRDKDITALREGKANADEVQKQLQELQTKYTSETTALNKKLKEQQEGYERQTATEAFFKDVKFSSDMAREAVIARFGAKNLKLENGAFTGAKEWLDELRASAPDAFAQEKKDEEGGQNFPRFGGSVGNGSGGKDGGAGNPFGFHFDAVRKTNKE